MNLFCTDEYDAGRLVAVPGRIFAWDVGADNLTETGYWGRGTLEECKV